MDDPILILHKYRNLLADGGTMFMAVPNASSLHRMLAHKGGLLPDIRVLSDADRRFGHKRFLTHDDWVELLASLRPCIEHAEVLYLKPLTTAQLESLKLDPRIHQALAEVGRDLPRSANSCFFVQTND